MIYTHRMITARDVFVTMRRSLRFTGRLFAGIAVAILLVTGPTLAQATSQPVGEGWEYRWGDLPFTANGVPVWPVDSAPEQWQAIDFPSDPPGRDGRNHVWYRVTLPAGDWNNPVLFIFSVDLIVQVWQGDQKLYQFGEFDAEGRGEFVGWPWHAVALPEDYHKSPLYFRIYSNYIDIGLWGDISIMEQYALMPYIVKNSLSSLVVGVMCVLLAVLAGLFALLGKDDRGFAGISLFAITSAVFLFAGSDARQLLWHQPLTWEYLEAGSYFMVPVALGLMLEQWLGRRLWRPARRLWQLHLLYAVVALGAALTGLVALQSTYPLFDAMFLASLVVMIAIALSGMGQMSGDQKLLLGMFGVYCLLLVFDMAVAHGVLPWTRVPVSWGILLFLLAITSISLAHYHHIHRQLRELNAHLEQEVAERTARAEALTARERRRVRLLTFENDKNRLADGIVARLQAAPTLVQAMDVLTPELKELVSPLRGGFYRPETLCTRSADEPWCRVSSWGYNGKPCNLQNEFANFLALPPATPMFSDIRDAPEYDVDFRAHQQLCLWINVQSSETGTHTVGVLQLEIPDDFPVRVTEYGLARLYFSLDQIIQKIGLTLSGVLLHQDLQRFSYEDALTGLYNRRYFNRLIQHEVTACLRTQRPLTVLIVDVDHFKRFNDEHGHQAGDLVLQRIAGVMKTAFRESDVVCRYGGEEFVIIMAGASGIHAWSKAEALRGLITDLEVEHKGKALGKLSILIGMASWPSGTRQPHKLIGLADKALYLAKQNGRNRVEVLRGVN